MKRVFWWLFFGVLAVNAITSLSLSWAHGWDKGWLDGAFGWGVATWWFIVATSEAA